MAELCTTLAGRQEIVSVSRGLLQLFSIRGDFKTIVGLQYIGAMNHPGGGRNDIPNRLKSKFFSLNMILPSLTSVDNIYGAMIKSRITLRNGATPAVRR